MADKTTAISKMASVVALLPEQTFAIMVHKLYTERVKDFLLRNGGWNEKTSQVNVQVLDTPELTGVSRARRGFVLLLLENAKRPIESLPPMARQNVSWAGRITHQAQDQTLIWSTLQDGGFQIEQDLLRVDVYPRDQTEAICLTLQSSSAKALDRTAPSDPFEGPIPMTMSASKCSHRLTVVCVGESSYYWGLMNRKSNCDAGILNMKLNHEAADQITVVAADSSTGKEVKQNVDKTAPLSRAYYKLDQVWDDYLAKDTSLQLENGTGIDLGACPGGWTQVLVHKMGLASVIAVDPGRPADRILNLPQVTHVKSDIASVAIEPYGPFSIVVCDASDVWIEIIKQVAETVVRKGKWLLPSVCVVTFKLPYKTLGSIQRHVDMMNESIPSRLNEMAAKMYPAEKVHARYQIVHLMANSDSERTLIAIFEKA